MTDRELMHQALNALEVMRPACFAETTLKKADAAITALRDRLVQTEQEPVAWVCEGSSSDEKHAIDYQQEDVDAIPIGTMLYTTPPAAPPKQEPVAWYHAEDYKTHFTTGPSHDLIGKYWQPLYTAPQPCPTCESLARTVMLDQTSHDTKRQWVGLTKEEAKEISMANRPYVIDMIAALEARLKEKNT